MEGNLIFFTTQRFTIQPDLFGRIEDEVGVLIIRQSPVLRRLCGWESVADVPSESTVSRAYDQFEFWLGPDEIAVATGEAEFPLVVFRALRSDDDIAAALKASGANDQERILQLIGSSSDAYGAFKEWAEERGDLAVVNSDHAGDSFAFGVKDLFENAPEVRFTDVSVNTNASGTLDVTVTVKDGDKPKPVKSENVAQMFEATTNVADWTEGRVDVDVTDRTKALAMPVKFTVKSGDGTSEKAFLRIRK